MTYTVATTEYSGPLEKLLELIEAKELQITRVSLAEVTSDFIVYVHGLQASIEPRVLADFLVVAARLILIKSKALLPSLELTEDEASDIRDLEFRLQLYRAFKEADRKIAARLLAGNFSFGRSLFFHLGGAPAVFYPPDGLRAADLIRSFERLAVELHALIPDERVVRQTIITLQGKIEELLARFTQAATHSFRKLAGQRSKEEIIVLFLALLHLLKDRRATASQTEHFGDIIISNNPE